MTIVGIFWRVPRQC